MIMGENGHPKYARRSPGSFFAGWYALLADLLGSRAALAPALARRLDVEPEADASVDALLRRAFPPDRFAYWLADRF